MIETRERNGAILQRPSRSPVEIDMDVQYI